MGLTGAGRAQERPGPGVPLELASQRSRAVADLRYDLRFDLPADRAAPVTGVVTATFVLRDPIDSLVLDFDGSGADQRPAIVDGRRVRARHVGGHLLLDGALAPGLHRAEIAFTASDAALNRSEEYLYTLFVPARAHEVFPCFDQPDLKARLSLTLEMPESWEAVANGREIERVVAAGRATSRYAETAPLSTYLMAFAAGRWSIESAEREGRLLRMFHRETDAGKLARNREAIFDLHASSLAWLEEYTDIPYPWGKLDFVLVPAFQFGGMEHAGAIFYNAASLLLEPSATKNQLLGRASLVAHETSHMWFGDLVTMRWFDDVWMKEVFANFMAAKIVNPAFPEVDHDLRFLLAHYRAAYDVDRTPGTHPIRQPLDNLAEAGALYGAIIYQKAPVVMRQLERLMGEVPLRNGLRDYLRESAFGNAAWPELVAVLDRRTDEDLASWSRVWIGQSGRPTIETEVVRHGDRVTAIALTARDPAGRGRVWPQALEIEIGGPDGVMRLPVVLRETRVVVPVAVGTPPPSYVLPSGGGLGYADFVLQEETTRWLVAHLPEMPDALSRGAAWATLWEGMLDARVSPDVLADLALRALDGEADELNVQRFLGDLGALYWRFLPSPDRDALTARIERSLSDGLEGAPTSTLKGAWFRGLVGLARSPEAVAWLTGVWRGGVKVPGLVLAERDLTDLSLELAVREAPGWRDILAEQAERISNPDRRARFAFVRPALDADRSVRAAFFERLLDPAGREHEPWVLEGLAYLHHPLRAETAVPFVAVALNELEEIQRTGDIFFPRRWMDATLTGHRSPEVAAIVERFLAERPDYPERLRRIVLQAADDLRRLVAWEHPGQG